MRKFRAASEHQEGGDLPLRLQRKPDCRAGRVPVTVGLRLSKGGVVIVDQNTRLSRVLDIVTIPTSPNTGSVTHADFAQGLPWWVTTNGGVAGRSEERRVGKEWVSRCKSRWSAD